MGVVAMDFGVVAAVVVLVEMAEIVGVVVAVVAVVVAVFVSEPAVLIEFSVGNALAEVLLFVDSVELASATLDAFAQFVFFAQIIVFFGAAIFPPF